MFLEFKEIKLNRAEIHQALLSQFSLLAQFFIGKMPIANLDSSPRQSFYLSDLSSTNILNAYSLAGLLFCIFFLFLSHFEARNIKK